MNPTRTGIIDVLEKMGATFTVEPINEGASEPAANITIETSSLKESKSAEILSLD